MNTVNKNLAEISEFYLISPTKIFLISTFLLSLLYGCTTERTDWEKIESSNEISSFHEYMTLHPDSEYADSAYDKVVEFYLKSEDVEDQILGFEEFIQNFAQTRFIPKANSTLNELYSKRDLFPVNQNGKMGFINKNGKLFIQAQFDHAEPFNDESALVNVDQKWGFINKSGEMIVQPQYEYISDFSEGAALVKVDEKWGFIDKVGNIVIEPKFDDAWPFSEGFALVKESEKWGFIDQQGEVVIPLRFDRSYSSEGTGFLFKPGPEGPIWISYDKNGRAYRKGLVDWLTRCNISLMGHWCYQQGTSSSSETNNWVDNFSEGLARVIVDQKWGYIDKTGNTVIEPKFQFGSSFSQGLAVVQFEEKMGYVDQSGRFVIEPQPYESVSGMFFEGLAVVKKDNKVGFIDKTGLTVIDFEYDEVKGFSEGMAAVRLEDKWGFINKDGEPVINYQFEEVKGFSEGLSGVKANEKWGFIDATGKTVVPHKFDVIDDFSKGIAKVSIDEKYGYIDKDGIYVWEPTQ